ncbi:MAG: spermidine/putrescine transport system permease protein [Thermoleophilales bacterium]|nr:spermidine/putrescine transport system permease protein [Thermoleophilales bacterium]
MSPRRRRRLLPYLLLAPGILWLGVFFLVPALNQAYVSLWGGTPEAGQSFAWKWGNYSDALSTYSTQIVRSLWYAAAATVLAFVIAFPLAYYIAFKAPRWLKPLLLLLIILPFFTSYLVRTNAWQTILADDGWVVNSLQSVGLVSSNGRLLATGVAVVAGITYNFLPFMALPLYVSLEKIDKRLIEAATDLYAGRFTAFRKVTMPLALPGIFAGSLLTFIPAVGDFVNASLLGSPRQYMIGNVIQSKFLRTQDYPEAAALSFILMALILFGVFAYTRVLGRERLTEAAV